MPALQQDRRQDMLKTAALLLSASLLCAPAHALADPLADIDSLILSNMHILGNWENDAPLAALAETPEPAAKPEQLAESPKQVFGLDGDRFKISVPEGWSAEAIHGGVRIVAGNGRSTLTAAILQTGGQSAEQIAGGGRKVDLHGRAGRRRGDARQDAGQHRAGRIAAIRRQGPARFSLRALPLCRGVAPGKAVHRHAGKDARKAMRVRILHACATKAQRRLQQFRKAPEMSGASGEIRTHGLLLRRQTLYPTELRTHAEHSTKEFPASLSTCTPGTRLLNPAGACGPQA